MLILGTEERERERERESVQPKADHDLGHFVTSLPSPLLSPPPLFSPSLCPPPSSFPPPHTKTHLRPLTSTNNYQRQSSPGAATIAYSCPPTPIHINQSSPKPTHPCPAPTHAHQRPPRPIHILPRPPRAHRRPPTDARQHSPTLTNMHRRQPTTTHTHQ